MLVRAMLLLVLAVPCGCAVLGRPVLVAAPAPYTLVPLLEDDEEDDGPAGWGLVRGVITYLPNRVFDLLDIVRARVRVGPGMAIGVRATEIADVYLGTYASVWAGLPGPRNRRFPKLPFGIETKSGAELGVADVTIEGGLGPDYGAFEVGFGFQAFILGLDVGIEPYEILDLVAGLVLLDPSQDDY